MTMKSMLGAIERTGDKISGRLEAVKPKLEKARFKAEAGLNVRRGWIPPPNPNGTHHISSREVREERAGLMRDVDGYGRDGGREDEEGGGFGGGRDIGESEESDEGERGVGVGGRGRRRERERERDEMKWPVGPGEGWVAL